MSPAEAASAAALARLREEVRIDLAAMARCVDDARDVLGRLTTGHVDRVHLIVGAVALHGAYTALETLLERVVRVVDRSVPAGPTSHRDLLSQAMTEVPHLRPAILSRAAEPDLLALLAFRDFFRHAYGVDPDRARRWPSPSSARRGRGARARRGDAPDRFVERAIEQLTRSA